MSNNIQDAYESVRKFNSIAGNLEGVGAKSVNAQLGFIDEELAEASEALYAKSAIELLDGACDLFVTVAGLMHKLEAAGFDVEGALRCVCDNNLMKFPTMEEVFEAEDNLAPLGTPCGVNFVEGRAVFKRVTDGKIMKPSNFVAVDLAGLAPEGFFA